jgi:protein SCO1/2
MCLARRVAMAAQVSLLILGLAVRARGQNKASVPPAQPQGVGIDLRLNNQVPLGLKFRDETGQTVTLASYFGKKPVILSLVYYSCPMMCTLTEHGLVDALRDVQLNLGQQYEVVTVSFDSRERPEMARRQKATYIGLYGRPDAKQGWHFLVGDQSSIVALAQAVGFRYEYSREIDQFNHPTGIMVLTPQGKVSRYFFGIQYPARDVRQALVDASIGKIANPAATAEMLQKGCAAGGGTPVTDGAGKTAGIVTGSSNHQPAPTPAGAERN